jgi:hypothetical protein
VEVLIESSAGLGAAIGLLRYAEHPVAAKPAKCPDPQQAAACIGHVEGSAINHILTAGLVGGLVGLGCALSIVLLSHLLWARLRSARARWREPATGSSGAGALAAQFALPSAPPRPVRRAIPERTRHEVWRRDRGRCVDCESRENLEFDHIIPVSRGGSNTARNLELRCETCNGRKAARI